MKRSICCLLLLVLLCAMGAPAMADQELKRGDLLYLYYTNALYAAPDRWNRQILCHIPSGQVVLYVGEANGFLCAAYGSYVGYLEDPGFYRLNDWDGASFALPDGSMLQSPASGGQDSWQPGPGESGHAPWSPDGKTYVPEFPYSAQYAWPNQQLATRSGPNTRYTWTEHFPVPSDARLFYQTEGNGVRWGYVEFTSDGQRYRLYTGMKRFDGGDAVPYDSEDYVWAQITRTHTPSYGPGAEYAKAKYQVSAGTQVKAFYRQNGYLLFEVQTAGGTQRAWALPETWR